MMPLICLSLTLPPPTAIEKAQPLLVRSLVGSATPARTAAAWTPRRADILNRLQAVMGRLPGDERRCPLDVQVSEANRGGPLRGGAEYTVTVSLKAGAQSGSISEPIVLKTNDKDNPLVQVAVSGTVAAPLEAAPARVRMENVAVGGTGSQRILIRAAKPFKLLGVDGAGEGLTVELPGTANNALPVQVLTVKFDRKKPGALDRELSIRTDLDGGATLTLPVSAEELK